MYINEDQSYPLFMTYSGVDYYARMGNIFVPKLVPDNKPALSNEDLIMLMHIQERGDNAPIRCR